MANFSHSWPATRLSGAGLVVLLHAAVIGGLIVSLSHLPAPIVLGDLRAKFIDEDPVQPAPPPPNPTVEPVPVTPIVPEVLTAAPIESEGGMTVTNRVPPAADLRHVNARPDYPEASIRLGEEGSVVLAVLVEVSGRVTDARIDRSSGYERLDQAALIEARRSYRFQPGTENGQPKAMWHKIKITFRLQDVRG